MKHFSLTSFLVLCLGGWAAAGPSPVYVNIGILTNRINIDARVFVNDRIILFDSLTELDGALFQTKDTSYYTNAYGATMAAQPGFSFNTLTSTGIQAAASFNNLGSIFALDAQVEGWAGIGNPPRCFRPDRRIRASTGRCHRPSWFRPPASGIPGCCRSGRGLCEIKRLRLNLSNGSLVAGSISEVDTNAVLARGTDEAFLMGGRWIHSWFLRRGL